MLCSSKIIGTFCATNVHQCRHLSFRASNCLLDLNVRKKYRLRRPLHLENVPTVPNLEAAPLGLASTLVRKFHEGFEPPYLRNAELSPATHPLVNIQVKGYDFSILQRYQAWALRVVRTMNLDVSDQWASPCKKLEITRLVPKSAKVDDTFKLNIYERNVQVSNLPSHVLPVLLEVLQAGLPQGVDLYVDHHSEEADRTRYVPNKELKELKQELAEIRDPSLVKSGSKSKKK